ncbi:ribosome small subunit-dependent GTPase A [bacterium SCSIO 12741]|nr:ribosome small subunit-dependent GTPase A [bacterium SCSIO 12741]
MQPELSQLGFLEEWKIDQNERGWDDFLLGRVILEHKERYTVSTGQEEWDAEILGNLRYTATSRRDFPAVGDWVALQPYEEGKALIHGVFPRKSILERSAVGKQGEKQIIATNIDYAFIVQSVNRDFSINRLERYLTLCYDSGVEPIVILSKIDLIDGEQAKELVTQVKSRMNQVPVYAISTLTGEGWEPLTHLLETGKTYCLLGSSGVGKSTILNALRGEEKMKTGEISGSIDRGKHVTTHRELVVLESGGILIDNPGMREVGMTDNETGMETTFEEILELAQNCRFSDCSHTEEKGCALLEAVDNGELDPEAYSHFMKLQREKARFEGTVREKRLKDKQQGKLYKRIINAKNKRHD